MDIRYSPFNITTALAIGCTLWIMAVRWRGSPESNWPLFYYLGVVVYSYLFPEPLEPRWIYAGVVTALFLRFEFMGGFPLKMVKGFEYVVLAYFLYAFGASFII